MQALFTATKGLAYVADVKILLPQSWNSIPADISTDIALEVASIIRRRDRRDPISEEFDHKKWQKCAAAPEKLDTL